MKVLLQNGCSCSNLAVHPKNWEKKNARLGDWYIHYRFYDPLFKDKYPYGFQKQIKGLKEYKVLEERQDVMRILLANEWKLLKEQQYNPITGHYIANEEESDYIIHPDTGFCDALQKGLDRMDRERKDDLKSTLKFTKVAAEQLRLQSIPIKDVRRRHIIMILDQCKKTKEVWTAATHNRYLKNLKDIFRELVRVEATEFNPCRDIEKKKGTKKIKQVLTSEERKKVDQKLKSSNYTFWRFIHIFFHSGSRTPEIMKVRKEDVSLSRQMVKYTIKKGPFIREVERPIKDCILHLWSELVLKAGPGQYLFSEGLEPGERIIRTDQIRRRWRLQVQIPLKIQCTWYSLKHLNTDEMAAAYGDTVAARLNEHGEDMVRKHYAVNHLSREHEIIKKAANTFA